jgi:DNA-binding transcriptional ArsR family regulator
MVNDLAPALDRGFGALAHPIRRGIVERLTRGSATVGEATAGFGVSKPAITKHLRVLEDAGVVVRSRQGRTHRLSLERTALDQTAGWLETQRTVWERMFDTVEDYLAETTKENE